MKDLGELKDLKYKILVCMDDAYKKGYKQGIEDEEKKRDAITDKAYYDGYDKGAFEAWECAREISLLDSNFASVEEVKNILKVFGTDNIYNILHHYTPQGAIKCLKDYKEKQEDEIKVGDEVYNLDPENKRIVTSIYVDERGNKQAVQMVHNGKYGCDRIETLTKTGRHFDEIKNVLRKMRDEE